MKNYGEEVKNERVRVIEKACNKQKAKLSEMAAGKKAEARKAPQSSLQVK